MNNIKTDDVLDFVERYFCQLTGLTYCFSQAFSEFIITNAKFRFEA